MLYTILSKPEISLPASSVGPSVDSLGSNALSTFCRSVTKWDEYHIKKREQVDCKTSDLVDLAGVAAELFCFPSCARSQPRRPPLSPR